MSGEERIIDIFSYVILIFSIIFHECAHGWAALRAGDPTAKLMGRLTLNPIPHIDLFGSIIIPLILKLSHASLIFGYAKPVPINSDNFRNPRNDKIKVSFAGPASNLLLSMTFLTVALIYFPTENISKYKEIFYNVLFFGMLVNIVLAFFNLLPIPPLDGSHILENVLPSTYSRYLNMIKPYGFIVILLVLFFTPFSKVFFHFILNVGFLIFPNFGTGHPITQ